MLWAAGAIVQVGLGLTTRVAVQVPTQPLASVTVAVYVPATPTVMDAPEAVNPPGPVQVKVAPAAALLAVKVAVAPWQTLCVAGAMVQVGLGLTIRVAVQVPTQPLASVTVAVYVPATPTVMEAPEAVNPPGPVQVKVDL